MVEDAGNNGNGPTVLVTGAGGQVGRELISGINAKGWKSIGVGHKGSAMVDAFVDITDTDAVTDLVETTKPDLIIHAAAMTDVEGCERFPSQAYLVNEVGSHNVARAARTVGARVIAISTDFVFSGEAPPYVENALPDPISVYGASKLAGERAVLDVDHESAIVRTAWVYGGGGKHFPRTVLALLRQRETIEVVEDERGNPTYAADLAQAIVNLAEVRPSGIYHLANAGSTSRYALAAHVAALAGLDRSRVKPTTTERFLQSHHLLAKRPKDSTLLNERAERLGVELRSWEDALASYMPVLLNDQQ